MATPSIAAAAPAAALIEACNADDFQVLHAPPPGVASGHARAHWLDRRLLRWPGMLAQDGTRFRLHHSAAGALVAIPGERVSGADAALTLAPFEHALPPALAERFRFVGDGATLAVHDDDLARLPGLHKGQLLLVHEDAEGRVLDATALQIAGALDDLYAAAEDIDDFGANPGADGSRFRLWAPTARAVAVCLYPDDAAPATAVHALTRDDATGAWSLALPGDLSGRAYAYLVDVHVRGAGVIRNRVTDPYSVTLGTNSRRSIVADLDAAALKPDGWDDIVAPTIAAQTDMVIYELHVRDFSRDDATVSEANRGKYLAFTETDSDGMRHLRAMAEAGLTDVHLLPVFDLATVPETGCVTPDVPDAAPDGTAQQAIVMTAVAAQDCFNWGYDPFHFNAPEGSFASDASDGAARIREFRQMVTALHAAGLRVGMDVVYNHTSASGQNPHSVLDRIVPGYYHRYDADGNVERSTCCDNTATEHRMMAKLMIDSAMLWARHYRIDSFRFDLMGHQPRAEMERLQAAVDAAAGRRIQLIGEGWNFGEVADGARFVQASQLSLAGSGIGTFSDRARDAVRGGGPADRGPALLAEQGWINGLVYAPNAHAPERPLQDLMRAADLVRVGLAGTLRDYPMTAHDAEVKPLREIDYKGQPAGYAAQPDEVVNYVENHDNQTLFDINVFKLPRDTSREDRARVQMLGAAVTAFSQGVAYFHAGIETLRSKSLDRNSYDSGDWFNRIDWTLQDNHFGTGLPPAHDNREDWEPMRPLLADARIKPTPRDIRLARDMFLDLLRIRASTPLFRLRSADEIARRLTFPNTGPAQDPRVIAGHLDGAGLADTGFAEVLYFINVDPEALTLELPELRGRDWTLHPVHRAAGAADPRPAAQAHHDAGSGRFTLPGRTALVYVVENRSRSLPPRANVGSDHGVLFRHEGFPSRHVAARNVDVWLPPGHDEDPVRRYPVLYMHDGQNLFDSALSYTGTAWGVDETMARLIASGTIRPAIVVGIWNTPQRFGEYMPQKAVTADAVATGVDAYPPQPHEEVISDAYLRFLVEELKPFVDGIYRTLPGRDDTFVMGSSMGGLVSLYAIAEYPRVFGGAAALSTHWPAGDGAVIDWLAAHLPDPGTHRLYLDHGTATLDAAYAPYQQRMDGFLRQAGYVEGANWSSLRFEDAAHDERAWRERLDVPLTFLLRRTDDAP